MTKPSAAPQASKFAAPKIYSDKPAARTAQLLVVPVAEETLVQDLESHQAHCLTPLAALIWQYCDGKTSVQEVTGRVSREVGYSVDEKVVWLAIHELGKAHLLEQRLVRPAAMHLSRRDLLRATGALAVTALVTSIAVPSAHAAAASTCLNSGDTCTAIGTHDFCCAGLSCTTGNTCQSCGVSGDPCGVGQNCCTGFSCNGGTCTPS